MSKKLFGFVLGALMLMVVFSAFGSAYHYHGYDDDYSRRTYHSTYERNGQFRATDYDRSTFTRYLADGSRQRTTTFTRTTTESPRQGYYRPIGYYGGGHYNAPHYGYGNYYGGYSYPRNYYVYRY